MRAAAIVRIWLEKARFGNRRDLVSGDASSHYIEAFRRGGHPDPKKVLQKNS